MSDISFKSIKSSIIIKYIFSFILETKKLKMIIHNKYFQTKIGIDLNYYKKVSGKKLILEKNGKITEYKLNTDILIFEGEYINGYINGPGEEYHKNGLIKFKGEYLNGKKWFGIAYNK